MKQFHCDKCNKSRVCAETSESWFCGCGNRTTEFTFVEFSYESSTYQEDHAKQSKIASLACRHRGPAIEELDCQCQGKPKIHSCAVHGKCVVRKLPRMDRDKIKDCHICLDCDDRSIYQPNKIGFAVQVFNKVGGMETWLHSLFMNVHEHTTGIYVNSSGFADIDCTASSDADALCQLAESSDIVLCWGFVDGLREAFESNPNCRLVAVHHGSLESTWANGIFKQQLEIVGDGIAVNQDVARHFGVQYLPNPVVDHGVRRAPRTEGPRRILWNHRWSDEKRPELALEIAKKLPSGYEMLVSASKQATLPPNCTNIGQNIDNTALLADSDVFLSTASQEAFGYSLAEAVLARVPIVCGPYGIGTEVASKIVDSDDPKAWATAIIETDDRFCESAVQWLDAHHGKTAIDTWKRYLEIV